MILTTQQCYDCGKETKHFDGKCGICRAKEHDAAEAKWNALTANDKIEILRARIESLERDMWPIR